MPVTAGLVVAGAGAAAGAASAATAKDPTATQSVSFAPPSRAERFRQRQAYNYANLDAQRLADLSLQGGFLSGEAYKNLGYDVEFAGDWETANAAQEVLTQAQADLDHADARIVKLTKGNRRGKGQEPRKLSPKHRRELRKLKNQREVLRNQLPALQAEAQRASQEAHRITGMKRAIDESTEAGRTAAIEAELEKRTLAALRGEAAADPVLEREIEGRRRALEEGLRRDLGPDYALSTSGSRALRDFERSSSEARSAAQRSIIADFIPLATQHAMTQAQEQRNLFGATDLGFKLFEAGREQLSDFENMAKRKQDERMEAATTTTTQSGKGALSDILGKAGQGLGALGGQIAAGGNKGPTGGGSPSMDAYHKSFNPTFNSFGETSSLMTPNGRLIM